MTPENDFEQARRRMVEQQLRGRDITDPAVLDAMLKVERHRFVPPEEQARAYGDHPLSIGHGQTISQPYMVASMTQELRLETDSRVLEIGAGCGYQTAVLAEIAAHVYAVELIPELVALARENLSGLNYDNITLRCGDGTKGWVEEAPFDAILVAAAAERIPPALIEQLKDPGRMVIPMGGDLMSQSLDLVVKKNGRTETRSLYGVRFVPLLPGDDSTV